MSKKISFVFISIQALQICFCSLVYQHLLFVLFINDIMEIFSCVCKLFADDVKMYATLDVNDDCKGLFDKLKSVEKWCSEWQLSI